jgi:hypothetical protein
VTVRSLTALISIHGARPARAAHITAGHIRAGHIRAGHITSEASLAGLLPVVEGRLRELARRMPLSLILINIDDRLIDSSIWNHANDPLS